MADCCVYSPDEDGYCDYCGRFHDEDNDAAPSIQPTEARITELENALNLALPFVDYCDAIGMVTAAEAREAARKVLGEGK